jgi:ABC-2 type transport system permease protein
MRTILYLIRKEFLQIFRNKFIARAIFAVPIAQMLILVPAVTFEIKNVRLCIMDNDMTPESRGLINKLEGSTFFRVTFSTFSGEEANNLLHKNKFDLILNIPSGFGRNLSTGKTGKLMVSIDAINASTAQLSWAYLNGIIRDYNMYIITENINTVPVAAVPQIMITNRFWYNEMLNYKHYMLPGILTLLVTVIGFLLAGLNMVREKEIGTIEQLNVTPVRKYQLIIAKMVTWPDNWQAGFQYTFCGECPSTPSMCIHISDSSPGTCSVYLNIFRDTTAVYVHCVFLHDHFHAYEWSLHSL